MSKHLDLKKGSVINIIFNIEIIFVFMIVATAIWEKSELTSFFIACNFVVVAVLMVLSINKQTKVENMLLWLFTVAAIVISVILTSKSITFNYLKKMIMFLCTICLFYWVLITDIDKKMIKSVMTGGKCLALLFIVAYFSGKRGWFGNNEEMLTFNLGNPNFAGMCLLTTFLTLIISQRYTKNRFSKFFNTILAIMIMYFIWITKARSSILAAVIFFLFNIFMSKKYSKKMTFFFVIFPLIFAIIYLQILDTDIVKWFEFAADEGKALDSRETVWKGAFALIKKWPFFGNYYKSTAGTGQSNLHNIHVDTIATYGVVTFSFVVAFLNRVLNKIGKNMKHKYQRTGIFAFYAIMVLSIFEAALFCGSQGLYVLVAGFLMIAKYDEDTELAALQDSEKIDKKI